MRGIFVWTKVKLGSHLVVNSREPGSENMKMLGSDYVVNSREQSRRCFFFYLHDCSRILVFIVMQGSRKLFTTTVTTAQVCSCGN